MRKAALILMAVMVILAGFAFVSAEGVNETNQTLPYVDSSILPAFENQAWIRVLVRLVDNSNITIAGTKEQRVMLSKQRDEWFNQVIDDVLTALSQSEFNLVSKRFNGFSGDIRKSGFDKLANDLRVSEINLAYGASGYAAENNSAELNQTETKPPEAVKPLSFFQRIINFFKSLFRWG